MPDFRLRDRDAIITREGLTFRVLGYAHPLKAWFCDLEYAPATVFTSFDPRAFRQKENDIFFKLYNDESWKLLEQRFPNYLVHHNALGKRIPGVQYDDVLCVLKPEERFSSFCQSESKDSLHKATQLVADHISARSGVSHSHFGVFGSLLFGFYHPDYSDIDLVVYGSSAANKVRETLAEYFADDTSPLRNEFETSEAVQGKSWKFQSYTIKDFLFHQRRKMIYALFNDRRSGRVIKTEFEPVKSWSEIRDKFDDSVRIVQKGWVRINARVTCDKESPFMPSVYGVQLVKNLSETKSATDVERIVSYMEEFRLQAMKDEIVYVEGNLEEVMTSRRSFYQIVLTYCPRYYEQVLKVQDYQGY